MASETTSPHHELVVSGPSAKTKPRLKNSRKFFRGKPRKRSSGHSSCDSEDADQHVQKCRNQGSAKSLVGGYSSSEEASESNTNHEKKTINYDDRSDEANWEQVDGYSLRTTITTNSPCEAASIENNAKGWELVEPPIEDDDVSLKEESSDGFWKTHSGIPPPAKFSSRNPSLFHKSSTGFSSLKCTLFYMLRNSRYEWKQFNSEYQTNLEILKQQRNKCAMGLLIVFILCGIGGIIFHSTEGAFEMYYKCGVKRVKRDFLDTLWSKRYMREDEWKSLARAKLMEFENQLYDAYDAGMSSYSGQKGWSFINSFIYCITLVTTIGYGHLAPVTTAGRVITIVYSIFGIPLFFVLLADYGKLFTRGIKYVWAFIRRLYYTGSCRSVPKTAPVQEVVKGVQIVLDTTNRRKSSNPVDNLVPRYTTSPIETPALSTYTIDDEFNLPVSVALGVLLMYMTGGALLFSYLEGWSIFESFYFVYISTSTIGLGDFVPKGQVYVLLWGLIYFVFGLALTSMCINVVTEKMADSFRQATTKIGTTIGLKMMSKSSLQLPEVITHDSEFEEPT